MPDQDGPFRLVQESRDYDDFDANLPDFGGVGLSVRLTLVRDSEDPDVYKSAYMVITANDENGYVFYSWDIPGPDGSVPLDWALRITGRAPVNPKDRIRELAQAIVEAKSNGGDLLGLVDAMAAELEVQS